MQVKIGTFNLNNLFSRYNFVGEVAALQEGASGVGAQVKYEFGPDSTYKLRTYRGQLVEAKDDDDTRRIARRITDMDLDVLAVQEVEDLDTLSQFNRDNLGGLYRHVVLVEGNDPRLIDVALLSKLPVGGVTSWRHAVHPAEPGVPVFGRDLLEIEVLIPSRSKRLFTVFVNHLKSHYVDWRTAGGDEEAKNDRRRSRQAEVTATIIKARTRPDSRYAVVGDMNDPPLSPCLECFVSDPELRLVNALTAPKETRKAKKDDPPPQSRAWTHRYKSRGEPAAYELYDQIWLSPSLARSQTEAWIDRRTRHGGDGSDHDPAWVVLEL